MKNRYYCISCNKEVEITIGKREMRQMIREEEHVFHLSAVYCNECGLELGIPELIDINNEEIDTQYRQEEGIVSNQDIKRVMELYHLGKAPLSLALGFGEITITRYLLGQIPSKEYSDIIYQAMTSPKYMEEKLTENKEKIAPVAYQKACDRIKELSKVYAVSEKMRQVIYLLFSELDEISPLSLQKLLYFIQGISLANLGNEMFPEECEAWQHGPVFAKVYEIFKDFKFNPIDDERFSLFSPSNDVLSEEEKKTVSLVASTFGMYGGKTLEAITHLEDPWKKQYKGKMIENNIISKKAIYDYFKGLALTNEQAFNEYIFEKLCEARMLRYSQMLYNA